MANAVEVGATEEVSVLEVLLVLLVVLIEELVVLVFMEDEVVVLDVTEVEDLEVELAVIVPVPVSLSKRRWITWSFLAWYTLIVICILRGACVSSGTRSNS